MRFTVVDEYGRDEACFFKTLRETISSGVVFVAIFGKKDYSLTHIHGKALAYYAVEAQQLHVDVAPETLGITSTELAEFKKARNGPDDYAKVLLFGAHSSMEEDPLPCQDPEYTTAMEGLYHFLHVDYDIQSPEEKRRNLKLWTKVAVQRIQWTANIDEDADEEEIAGELGALRQMDDLWPVAVNKAYASVNVADLVGSDTPPELARYHYEMSQRSLTMATKWPTSLRCTWIVSCIQGALDCKKAEEEKLSTTGADMGVRRKRGRLTNGGCAAVASSVVVDLTHDSD